MTALSLRSLKRVSLVQPLAGRDFRLLWIGETVSLLGDQFHFIALSWLVLRLTGSGLALGGVLTVASVPRALFMLVGGAMSDRLSLRWVMVVSNVLRAGLVAALTLLIATGGVRLWHLYLLAAVFGIVDAFFHPAFMTIVPRLVGRDRLEAGNALVRGSAMLTLLVGPAPAGVLIALVGLAPAFAIDAASFAFSAVMLWLMREPAAAAMSAPRVEAAGWRGVLGAVRAGLIYAWRDPAVRMMLVLVAAIDFAFVGPFNVGIASLADRRFVGGSAALGAVLSAWGGGALVGTAIAGLLRPGRHGVLVIVLTPLLGVGLGLIGVAPTVAFATAVTAAMGLGSGLLNVVAMSWLQGRTEAGYLGRVMSLVSFASLGLAPVSYAVAGALVDVHATVLFLAAGGIVIAAGAYAATSAEVRRMR